MLPNKIGLYMRLSRDDEREGESASIEHQRAILTKYVEERGGIIVDEYVDDGYSGTNFDRPEIKRLLADAQAGKVDTIVVKDLSRFGRNYIQVGQYIDYIFPAYGIRFIAVGDNVDTAERSSAAMDMMPIMNVFNEWHAASTSRKIRAVLQASRRAGKFTGWNYPYGYRAGTDEKRTAVIDEEAARTVRTIFGLRLEGRSAHFIAARLTEEGIPNPATHFRRKDGQSSKRVCSARWSPKTVMEILKDPVYIGRTVQHKTASVSYKNHTTVKIPKEEQIVRENAHPPIIPRALWESVQTVNAAPQRGSAERPFSGLLVCANCGKKLKYQGERGGGAYVCRTYKDLGKRFCSVHRVSEETLKELLRLEISSLRGEKRFDRAWARGELSKARTEQKREREEDEKKRAMYKKRLNVLENLLRSAFESHVLKALDDDAFSCLCRQFSKEREEISRALAEIERRLARKDGEREEAFLKNWEERYAAAELTRELCLQLIEKIVVGEADEEGLKLHVVYKFSAN